MNKVWKIIKENIPVIVLLLVVIAIFVTFAIIDKVNESKIYESPLMNGETIEYENKVFEENEYDVMEVSNQDMALRYYRYIINYLITDPEVVWDILDPQQRKEYGKLSEFKRHVKKILSINSASNTLIKYGVDDSSSAQRVYVVVDSEHYSYTITERGVWNITVKVNGKVNPDSM